MIIGLEVFLAGLLLASVLTGLTTEAVKTMLTEHNKEYRANTLAGIIALIISAVIGTAYIVLTSQTFAAQSIVYLIALIFMSWLCAMVGYDKVIQAISQFKTSDKK